MRLVILFLLILAYSVANAAPKTGKPRPMSYYPEVKRFIAEISKKHKLDKKYVQNIFDKIYFDMSVVTLMETPAESKSWDNYSKAVITTGRVTAGVSYLQKHEDAFEEMEKLYGVPRSYVAAIIGLESNYGNVKPKRKAVTSLATLAFRYPRRASFFKSELTNLILYAAGAKIDPLSITGSYAGAIGITQFMPGNILKYGKDGDNDSVVDIINSHPDAIASVGNYLSKYGWNQDNSSVYDQVELTALLGEDNFSNSPCSKSSRKTALELKEQGVLFPDNISDNRTAALTRLGEDNESYSYIALYENACPIYKYNSSLKYALAIAILASLIETARAAPL